MLDSTKNRWQGHRGLATAVELLIFLSPVVAASGTVWVLLGVSPAGGGWQRGAELLLASAAVGCLVERLARRLLPLSALLRLTMVFPDRAPSRFSVARQAGNPQVLMAKLGSGDLDQAEAAASILGLVGALAAHDRKTRGHSERVRAYTDLLSEEMGLPEADRDRLRWSALLHDIGKLRVGVDLLNKAGKPSAAQWAALQAHPEHGRDLAASLLPWLGEWGSAIVQHHERFDGGGYPHGLAGEQLSLGARIVSVVDSFETMTSVRAYKKVMSHQAARAELTRCAGTQFDPLVVRAFLAVSLPQVLWAMGPLSALLQVPWISTLEQAGSQVVGAAGSAAVTAPLVAATVLTAVAGPTTAAATAPPPDRPAVAAVHQAAEPALLAPEELGSDISVSHGGTATPKPLQHQPRHAPAGRRAGDRGGSPTAGPHGHAPKDHTRSVTPLRTSVLRPPTAKSPGPHG